jgi:hypothetical protein
MNSETYEADGYGHYFGFANHLNPIARFILYEVKSVRINTSTLKLSSLLHIQQSTNFSGEESMMAMPDGRWVWASGPIESNL